MCYIRIVAATAKFVRLTPEQQGDIISLRRSGAALSEIVKQTGYKLSTVRWTLAKAGVVVDSDEKKRNMSQAHRVSFLKTLVARYGVSTWNEVMDKYAAKAGGTRIGEYINSRTPIKWKCSQNHLFSAKPANIQQGQWCPECAHVAHRLPISVWRERARRLGGELVSEYLGCDAKHLFKCSSEHEFWMVLSDLKNGHWCPSCAGNNKSTPDVQAGLADGKGGTLISPASNVMDKALWSCQQGHRFTMRVNNVQQGQWCPTCSAGNHASKGQLEVLEYTKSLVSDVNSSERSVIPPLELDIYVPSCKVAMEYNGLLWHSSYVEKVGDKRYNKYKHVSKYKACISAGVSLFAIFEDEWVHKTDLIRAMIRWRLGGFVGTKLNARDLELRRLDVNKQFEMFFERNHLDGHTNASYAYGLFQDGRLVMCASVRRNFAGEMELARLATDYDYSVRGGAARLISAIRKSVAGPLVSYSNNRLSHGGMYEALGFTKVSDQRPSYWYTDGRTERIWRFQCKRNNDPSVISQFPTEKAQALGGVFSEKAFGDRRPLYQIHDYGHIKWRLP